MYSLTGRILCQPLYRKIYLYKEDIIRRVNIFTPSLQKGLQKAEGEGFAPPTTAPNATFIAASPL